MISGTVIRDDAVWQGHPDVAYFNETIFIVFRQSDYHVTQEETSIQIVSKHKNNSFRNPIEIFSSKDRLNCPRLSVINDTLWIICDEIERSPYYIKTENDESKTRILMWKSKDGFEWRGPLITNITGIVPDKICENKDGYLIATHTSKILQENKNHIYCNNQDQKLVQNIWHTKNLDNTWIKYPLCHDSQYNLCEASVTKLDKKFLCLMRENSGLGLPAMACFSKDGIKWDKCFRTRMFGCHRPVTGFLRSGNLLTTYREASHSFVRGYWAKNTFACLTTKQSIKHGFTTSIILPIDHDKSKNSDSGYTGWVQLPDDSIFIVNYITGYAPKPYIRWYQILESDF